MKFIDFKKQKPTPEQDVILTDKNRNRLIRAIYTEDSISETEKSSMFREYKETRNTDFEKFYEIENPY